MNDKVFMPQDELDKEPHYFSFNYEKGFEWYSRIFLGASVKQVMIGDASTSYLSHPLAAERIHNYDPYSKIVIILRNPADRAYSLYRWMVQEGYEYAGSFEKALVLESSRMRKEIPNFYEPEYYYNYLYYHTGLYYEQVKRYLNLFGNNVLIIKFDNFINRLLEEYRNVCEFLDIEANPIYPTAHNISRNIYSPKLQFLFRKINNFIVKVGRVPSTKAERDSLMTLGMRKGRRNKIDAVTKRVLMKQYREDIDRLGRLTNIDFSDWLSD